MSVGTVVRFYEGTGQQLVDERRYPSDIASYRRRENEVAVGVASLYQVVLEVGCMSGCLLYDSLRDLPLAYIGIDVVESAVTSLRQKIADEQQVRALRHALTLDIVEVECISEMLVPGRSVAMFPFNSFGNLPDPIAVLDALARAQLDVWIGTYDTCPNMTAVRREYYEAAAIGRVEEKTDESGVVFTSAQGLRSYAYSETWLRQQLVERGYDAGFVREDDKFVFVRGRLRTEKEIK